MPVRDPGNDPPPLARPSLVLRNQDKDGYAWARLRSFQNIDGTASKIADRFGLPRSQLANARKQAQQIRYCLQQAQEYFAAAQSVTIATKPLLIYYAAMSLALAEILWKQDGLSSLDKLRVSHDHHGLTLRVLDGMSKSRDLEDQSAQLVATPMVRSNGRSGTFEVWHRSAHGSAVYGYETTKFANGTSQTGTG